MGKSVGAGSAKRQPKSRADNEPKRRVAGDESYYTFVLQRYDGVVMPDVALRLPSVTSIIKGVMGASGGGMAYWGFRLGTAAAHLHIHGEHPDEDTAELLYEAAKAGPFAPNRQRDKAGERGNNAHAVLEGLARGEFIVKSQHEGAYVLGGPTGDFTPDGYGQAVVDWWISQEPQVIAAEQVLYSLKHRYCGSVDLIANRPVGGGLVAVVTDLKTHKPATSNGPAYDEDRIQVAAYREAWHEMFPGQPIAYTSVLIACEDGSWQEDWKEQPFEVFAALRAVYALLKEGGDA